MARRRSNLTDGSASSTILVGGELLLAAGLLLSCGPPSSSARPSEVPSSVSSGQTPPAADHTDPKPSAPHAPARAPRPPITVELPELIETEIDVPIPPIEDETGRALQSFYRRLGQLVRGQTREPVRIVVYGDSNLTRDLFTGELRRWLQPRFGDAGHGYVAIGVPWPWYRHQDVVHGVEPKAWKSFAVSTDPAPDQWYGLGGIAAECRSWGARAWVGTAREPAVVGTTASRADVFFLQRPRGRSFRVQIDGETVATVNTEAAQRATGFRRFEFEDAPHRIKFLADGGVRLFGVALERAVPGIVVDSIGIGGANERILARMNPQSVREALAHRPYDLIVFLTGATEDANAKHDVALKKRIRLHQGALPGASLLVMSPPDFANGSFKLPRPSGRIVKLGRQKRAVAQELGCAFWDFHAAMGGKLSIARFALRGMAEPDLAHLTEKGHAYMARRFLWALLSDFRDYLKQEAPEDCAPPELRDTAEPSKR